MIVVKLNSTYKLDTTVVFQISNMTIVPWFSHLLKGCVGILAWCLGLPGKIAIVGIWLLSICMLVMSMDYATIRQFATRTYGETC